MLYFCIPAYNEAPTVGLLIWRLRKVFQEQPREYEVLVYDDGSTDSTAETLAPYHKVMPLSVLGGTRVGYAAAVDALCREASRRTRYPRRDAVIVLQADFTDQPEHLPELLKRFDGGADIVVAERPADAPTVPQPVRTLRRVAPWLMRPFVSVAGVRDPFGTLRLYRVSVIRDLIKERGDAPLLVGEGWAANVDLLLRAAPHRPAGGDGGARAALRRAPARDTRPGVERRHVAAALRPRGARPQRPSRARMIRPSARRLRSLGLAALCAGAPAPALAQEGRMPVPFGVGERLEYDVRFGKLKVGSGTMEVAGIQEVRGRETWHTVFTVRGGNFMYRVNDRYESWIDTQHGELAALQAGPARGKPRRRAHLRVLSRSRGLHGERQDRSSRAFTTRSTTARSSTSSAPSRSTSARRTASSATSGPIATR